MENGTEKTEHNSATIAVKLSDGRTAMVRKLPPLELGAFLLLGTTTIDAKQITRDDLLHFSKADFDRLVPHVEWATGITSILAVAEKLRLRK